MKSKFYALLILPVVIFSSCTKWLPNAQQNIAGSWKIASVEQQTPNGSVYAHTGYEDGVFYFSNNGNAQYSDTYGQMNGTWRIVPHAGEAANSLELRLYDVRNDDAIEWEFYTIDISGSRIVGYMNRYGTDYRYEFRRY